MRAAATIAAVMLAATASAQWSTNAWPSWQHPRAGSTHAWECYSGLVERAYALHDRSGVSLGSFTPPDAPSFWRSQRANLMDAKQVARDLLDTTFFDPVIWVVPSNNYAASIATNGALVALVESNALAIARLPTNYFDYTPWRALCGAGPFDDDPSVGHPHGWTNEETASGGPYLPAGRTNWYTTDYGWAGLTNIIGLMSTLKMNVGTISADTNDVSNGDLTQGGMGSIYPGYTYGVDYASHVASNAAWWASAAYPYYFSPTLTLMPSEYWAARGDGTNYTSDIGNYYATNWAALALRAITNTVDAYMMLDVPTLVGGIWDGTAPATNRVYDAQGWDLPQGVTKFATFTGRARMWAFDYAFGDPWQSCPHSPDDAPTLDMAQLRGWQLYGLWGVCRPEFRYR